MLKDSEPMLQNDYLYEEENLYEELVNKTSKPIIKR
jgi:hypothetical protein